MSARQVKRLLESQGKVKANLEHSDEEEGGELEEEEIEPQNAFSMVCA